MQLQWLRKVSVLLHRNWAATHLQNIWRKSCPCHLGVYHCRYFFNWKNSGAQPCINMCRHFFNRGIFSMAHPRGQLWRLRCHALCFPDVCVILLSHTSFWFGQFFNVLCHFGVGKITAILVHDRSWRGMGLTGCDVKSTTRNLHIV